MKHPATTTWPLLLLLPLLLWQATVTATARAAITFTDSDGQSVHLPQPPRRVVSLVPSVTEILLALGAGDALVGATLPFSPPPETRGPQVVGGFLAPDLESVAALAPDLIFHADIHRQAVERFQGQATLVRLAPSSVAMGLTHIEVLGQVFAREQQAQAIVAEQRRQLAVIAAKIERIAAQKRPRVMRLMGRDKVMAPGDDSFQLDFIRLAGGEAPRLGRDGQVVPVSLEQWQGFNPQVLYGCGGDHDLLPLLRGPGWREVEAVRQRRMHFFPCELTCRIGAHPADFVSWLAASLYEEEFSDPARQALPEKVIARRPLPLGLDPVASAKMVISDIEDFRHKTLLLSLSRPMTVLSTLEGQRQGVRMVANHFFPPPAWGLGHRRGLDSLRRGVMGVLEVDPRETAMLFTGADMDHVAVAKKRYRDLEVTALVTAGVRGNAMRMGVDEGLFYEPDGRGKEGPGTINILLLGNCRLSPGAMSRAIITATEAKSAALQDLDIRSSAGRSQATGTGTDNILVIEGDGPEIDGSGGHTRMGELIAAAVSQGVREAIRRHNGLAGERPVIERLEERGLEPGRLCPPQLRAAFERLLLTPRHASFLEAAMAVDDARASGRIADISTFRQWCQAEAEAVAGGATAATAAADLAPAGEHPLLSLAIDALVRGLAARHDLSPPPTLP